MQTDTNSPFMNVIGLGALKSAHKLRNTNKWTSLLFGGGCLALVPILLAGGVYSAVNAYSRYGIRRVDDELLPALVLAGFALLIGGFFAWNVWSSWGLAVNLYENGFAHFDRKGLKQVKWDQVEAVWQAITKHYRNGIYTGTTHVYTVQTRDKQKIVVDDKLEKVEELGKAIQSASTNALWPKYFADMQAGQRLAFGPLALDTTGMYSGNKALRWDEIESVKLVQGSISVKKKNGGWLNWAAASVPQIPNFFIFYELVSRFAKME